MREERLLTMSWWYEFPKAAPRPNPKPGKRGKKFGLTWWGKKWVDVLSQFECDQRMSRGRAYARADRVKDFKIEKGKICAAVKGSLGTYKVDIKFDEFKDKDWNRIVTKLNSEPLLVGKLLNNEMPEELDESWGYKFVPESFKSDCSCPDSANPCKHIAAVFYTLADEIDYDPMILFKLRGMEKEKLFNALGLGDESVKSTVGKPAKTVTSAGEILRHRIMEKSKKHKNTTQDKKEMKPRKKSKKKQITKVRRTAKRQQSRITKKKKR